MLCIWNCGLGGCIFVLTNNKIMKNRKKVARKLAKSIAKTTKLWNECGIGDEWGIVIGDDGADTNRQVRVNPDVDATPLIEGMLGFDDEPSATTETEEDPSVRIVGKGWTKEMVAHEDRQTKMRGKVESIANSIFDAVTGMGEVCPNFHEVKMYFDGSGSIVVYTDVKTEYEFQPRDVEAEDCGDFSGGYDFKEALRAAVQRGVCIKA